MNQRLRVLLALLISAVLLAGSNKLFNYFHLFFQVWWADVLLHYLGGFTVALAASWFHLFSGLVRNTERSFVRTFIFIVLGTVAVGMAWEVFEIATHAARESRFLLDTSQDVLMDALGALTVHAWAVKHWLHE